VSHAFHSAASLVRRVLDGAFSLYRRNFATFAATVLVPGALVAAANVLWGGPLFASAERKDVGEMGAALMRGGAVPLLLSFALGVVTWCALTHQASRACFGEPVSLVDGLRAARRSALALLGAVLICAVCAGVPLLLTVGLMTSTRGIAGFGGLVFAVAFACVVTIAGLAGCLALAALFFAVSPAVVCEGAGPVAAVVRSGRLARGALRRIMALFVALLVLDALIARGVAAFDGVPRAIQSGADPSAAALIVQQLLALGTQVFTVPFTVSVIIVAYHDRRVRIEALDVQMMTESLAVAED
jgi:hypothetical protein